VTVPIGFDWHIGRHLLEQRALAIKEIQSRVIEFSIDAAK
jgi:hypothetical protein